jgi:hypothetical protein
MVISGGSPRVSRQSILARLLPSPLSLRVLSLQFRHRSALAQLLNRQQPTSRLHLLTKLFPLSLRVLPLQFRHRLAPQLLSRRQLTRCLHPLTKLFPVLLLQFRHRLAPAQLLNRRQLTSRLHLPTQLFPVQLPSRRQAPQLLHPHPLLPEHLNLNHPLAPIAYRSQLNFGAKSSE